VGTTEVAKKWKIAFLLSIIVPVGLLAGFALFRNQAIPEKVFVNAVSWEMERPNELWGPMTETVENTYNSDNCSILFRISINHYIDHDPDHLNVDCTFLIARVNASVSNGFIEGLRISFTENYNASQVNIMEAPDTYTAVETENLKIWNVVDYADKPSASGGLNESFKGYMEATGMNRPANVYLRNVVHWLLRSQPDQNNEMEVVLQLTYYNGSALKEAVMPIVLKLASDAGDTFETAKEIGFGNYAGWANAASDIEDFYKIWIDQEKTVKIQLSPKERLTNTFELDLYNSSGELIGSSASEIQGNTEQITFTTNEPGYWYLRTVIGYAGIGLYTLSIEAGT
jgi:hypothetical protein